MPANAISPECPRSAATPGKALLRRGAGVWALGFSAALMTAASVPAQELRPAIGSSRSQTANDFSSPTPGTNQLPDLASYGTPSGATASGATSRRAPPRTSKPVKGAVKAQNRLVRQPVQLPTGIVDLQPPPLPRKNRRQEEDPFAALGVDLGGVMLRPAITASGGYDDNPNRSSTNARGSWLARTDAEIIAQSDWSRHELKGAIKGGYSRYFSAPDASRPDASGKVNLKLDFDRDTFVDVETRFNIDTQRPGSPDLNANVKGRPLTYAYGASAGVSRNIDPVTLSLRGSVDRATYADAELTNGRKFLQSDRDATTYGIKARAAYTVSPGLKPFIEAGADTRQFDQTVDVNGFKRSSNGLSARTGASFELTRLLTGEASVGYQTRKFDDSRLNDLRGLVGDASLTWTASELTTVTLRGTTELNDTTIPGVNGAVARRAELRVAHALMRNVILTGVAAYGQTDFSGITLKEDTTTLGLKLDWKLSRNLAFTASFANERLKSTTPGSDYAANIYLAGLKFQL